MPIFCILLCILLIFTLFRCRSAGKVPLWDKRHIEFYTRLSSEKGQKAALLHQGTFLPIF